MTIKIRHAKKLKDLYGNCAFPTASRVVITVNRQFNKRLATYAATLLHELLHAWIHILELNGLKVDDEAEHKFIYATEQAVLREFRKLAPRRK